MTVIHVIEPFASGVTTAIISITRKLKDDQHIVIHGSRMWVDSIKNVRNKFPSDVQFISWKYAGREINPIKDLGALFYLIKILKKYKNAVIHLHSSKAGFLGRAACRLLGIKKVIYTPHCPAFIRTDISQKKIKMYKRLEKIGNSFGGKIVGCGKTEAKLYREMGIEAQWVSNGVEPRPYSKGLNPVLITFVGIANEQKNPDMFNRIASAFDKENVKFLWVGDGHEKYKAKLTSKNIKMTGWVDKEDVQKYLKETFIYLSTSGWEGLPFGVLEAMNASCALLLSDVPGNCDLVKKGENGYLFKEEEEAISFLGNMLADRNKTLSMGESSRMLIKKEFSLAQMGEGYRAVYKSMID